MRRFALGRRLSWIFGPVHLRAPREPEQRAAKVGFPGHIGGHHQWQAEGDESEKPQNPQDGFEGLGFNVFVAHESGCPEGDDGVCAAGYSDDRCVGGCQKQICDPARNGASGEQAEEMLERDGAEHGASKDNDPEAIEQHVHQVAVHQAIGEKGGEGLSGIKPFGAAPKAGPEAKEEGGDIAPVLSEQIPAGEHEFKQGERGKQEPERFGYRI